MFGNNREDQLLNKLKNCIGSLKSNDTNFQQSKFTSLTYNNIKQNYQITGIDSNKYANQNLNNKNSSMNPYQHTERPVLVPSNNNPPQLYNYLSSDKKKPNSQYEARQNLVKIYDNKETQKKYYNNFNLGQRQIKSYHEVNPKEYISKISVKNREQTRGQVPRRYSQVHNEKINHKFPQDFGNQKRTTTKNYRKQVQQRKLLFEGDFDKNNLKFQRIQQTKTNHLVGLSLRQQISKEPPRDVIFSSRKNANNSGVNKQVNNLIEKQRLKGPITQRQEKQKSYLAQKDSNASSCSALLKLKKISELNEKINDRIRNIINVFEENKN